MKIHANGVGALSTLFCGVIVFPISPLSRQIFRISVSFMINTNYFHIRQDEYDLKNFTIKTLNSVHDKSYGSLRTFCLACGLRLPPWCTPAQPAIWITVSSPQHDPCCAHCSQTAIYRSVCSKPFYIQGMFLNSL